MLYASGLHPRGKKNIASRIGPVRNAPAMISGRRRPQRERKLSEKPPTKGSVTASSRRPIARIAPITAGFTPSPILYTGLASWWIEFPVMLSTRLPAPNASLVRSGTFSSAGVAVAATGDGTEEFGASAGVGDDIRNR